ncbi:hypothetical protein ABL78_8387 [Leptomonas seymouri]|uniref:Secreted protein n=1 Tax=Leptomonas seymouri TaxID=5684 RepID=A0A0N1HZ86_LEPSE|nr:hypothetical protein ABL78_8387 [Leptomonas seymouri]|eukprot:KPI82602.1 hypothetical protein ABL78_8387 [Leptomonas seymouri]
MPTLGLLLLFLSYPSVCRHTAATDFSPLFSIFASRQTRHMRSSFSFFSRRYRATAHWRQTDWGEGADSLLSGAEWDAATARLEDSRAAGPDGVFNEVLHHRPREVRVHLLTLINWMWLTHHVPQQWKNAHAAPLPEPGKPPGQPSSYRPIRLASCVSKLMQRMALARLLHVWHPHICQDACRRGCTAEMELARVTDTVEHNRGVYYRVMLPTRSTAGFQVHYRAMRTPVILVAASRAFGTRNLSTLVKGLQSLPGSLLKHWLRYFLVHRGARVKLGNRMSEQHALCSGVPQAPCLDRNGSPRTPRLF